MTTLKKIAFAASAAALVTGFASQAMADTVWGRNSSKNAIWVTVYAGPFHSNKKGYFCVLPGQTNLVADGALGVAGGPAYMRAEVKKSATSCGDASNIYDIDTSMPVQFQNNRSMVTYTSSRKDDRPNATVGWK